MERRERTIEEGERNRRREEERERERAAGRRRRNERDTFHTSHGNGSVCAGSLYLL